LDDDSHVSRRGARRREARWTDADVDDDARHHALARVVVVTRVVVCGAPEHRAERRLEKNKRKSERVNQERFRNDSIRVVRARHTAKWVHVGVDAARTDVKVEGEASDRARRGGQNEEGRRESTRKIIKQRKGKFAFSPSSTASVVSRHKQNADITRQVNEKNELEFSRRATASGGTFRLLKAPEGVELGEANRGPKPKKRAKPVVKTPAQLQAEKNASKWSY